MFNLTNIKNPCFQNEAKSKSYCLLMIISFILQENKKIICNGFMRSLASKQRLGAVTENILTPSFHGRSLKILLRGWGGLGVFESISLLPSPTPLRKSRRRGPLLKFFLRGGGGVCRQARTVGLDSLLNEEVIDI